MVFQIVWEMDDFVVIDNDHAIWTANKTIVLVGGVFGNELLQREKSDGQTGNMYCVYSHCNWEAMSVGKGPIDIANTANGLAAGNVMQCDILSCSIGVGFEITNVAAGSHGAISVGNYNMIIQCDRVGAEGFQALQSEQVTA